VAITFVKTVPATVIRAAALLWALGTASAACAAAADDSFDVLEYRVRGNSVLDAPAIERAVYPHLGPGRGIGDVEQARLALEEAYRAAGYPTVLVDVPEQDVANGLVTLQVTEGRVDRLVITGARYFSNGWIREQMPELQAGSVPRLAEFQSELRALNGRSPDRTITPVLRPGRSPGTVEAELKVSDELPLHAGAELNNRNTPGTSDTRLNLSAGYNNLWQREHSLNLQYQVSPEERDETDVWAASYAWKPRGSDKTFVIYGVDSDSDVATVADLSVIGNGQVLGGQFIWPLRPTENLYQGVTLGVAWKDFEEVIGFDAEGEDDIVTPIDYIAWSAGYQATRVGEERTQTFTLGANFGIRDVANEPNDLASGGGGSLSSGEFEDKRSGADPNFFYLTGGYQLRQPLPGESALYWGVSAQFSPSPLVSNEQFAAGGADSVRGYFEAEVLGDYGVQSTLEWQGPNLGPRTWKPVETLQGLVFVDFARLSLTEPLPDQVDEVTLASAGVGLRLSLFGFLGALDWAWPFRDGSATESGDDRLLFKVRYDF